MSGGDGEDKGKAFKGGGDRGLSIGCKDVWGEWDGGEVTEWEEKDLGIAPVSGEEIRWGVVGEEDLEISNIFL